VRSSHRSAITVFILLLMALPADAQFGIPPRRRDEGPKPKNVHGLVQDLRGKPLAGARVFIRDTKSNTSRTVETDADGLYRVFALPPTVDYEIHAEFKGKASDKKIVSSFLNREDNLVNFQLDVAAVESASSLAPDQTGPSFQAFDLTELHASFDMPVGIPAPIPAVLLLHGYGEDRTVWRNFAQQLVGRGWAVMALDLRGHGESKTRNKMPLQATPEWRTDLHTFPVDLDPALDWLKARPRIDTQKIVVIGVDVGANLALISSGRFPEVRTVVAIKPNLMESLALAGSAQDFHPRSALIVVPNETEGNRIRALVQPPSRILVSSVTGDTAQASADSQIAAAVFQWLRETF
jgi:pimeloyl-ACP methyl ester carboxylesterase